MLFLPLKYSRIQDILRANPFITIIIALIVLIGYLNSILLTIQSKEQGILYLILISVLVFISFLVWPLIGAASVIGFSFVNPSFLPPIFEFKEISFRYVDIFIFILAFSIYLNVTMRSGDLVPREYRKVISPLIPLFIYIAFSLLTVMHYVPEFVQISTAAYLRLIATAVFSYLVYSSIRSNVDLNLFNKILVFLGIASVIIAFGEAWIAGDFASSSTSQHRYSGVLGIDSLGLVSGILMLYSILSIYEKHRLIFSLFGFSIAIMGLVLTKSMGSILAALCSIGIYMVFYRGRKISVFKYIKVFIIGVVGLGLFVILAWNLRRGDIVGLFDLSGGSFSQRLMISYAGLLIFLAHPILGTGWRATVTDAFMGSPVFNMALMDTFPNLPQAYFFLEKTMSLHNMYIQLLAELGILGFSLFIYGCFKVGGNIRIMLANIPNGSPIKFLAKFYTLAIFLILIWWNTNALYGGQIESILAFTFLGLLAAIGKLEKQRNDNESNM